jgi:sugar transferase (PEP-CTERM/EpsH1 system associated)
MPATPDLLYVVHRLPYPPDKGDRIRAFHIIKYLAERSVLHVACLADEAVDEAAIAGLQRHAAQVAVVPLGGTRRWLRALGSLVRGRTITEGAFSSPDLRTTLRQWARATPFRACLASASSMAPYLQLPEFRDVPAIVDLVDVDSQKWVDYAAASKGPRSWPYRLEARRLRRLEQCLASWTRGVVVTTSVEAAIYDSFTGPGTARVVANGVDLDYFRPEPGDTEPTCVFVGALDYRPNVEGVGWFCREVWPTLRQRRPEARMQLVGRRPAAAVRNLAGLPGVEVVGQVPDVRPCLRRAAVAVVPLQIARGVQNKVLEALAMAKAVVASPACVAGLQTQHDVHLKIACNVGEWTETVLSLLANQDERERLGAAGRRYVEQHHRWETCLAPLGNLLAEATGLPFSSLPNAQPLSPRGNAVESAGCPAHN